MALRPTSPGQDISSSKMWIFWASTLHSLTHSRPTWDSSSPSTKGLDDSSHTAKLLTSLSFELDWRRKRKSIVKTPQPKHTYLSSCCCITKPLMQLLLIKLLKRSLKNLLKNQLLAANRNIQRLGVLEQISYFLPSAFD